MPSYVFCVAAIVLFSLGCSGSPTEPSREANGPKGQRSYLDSRLASRASATPRAFTMA